MKIKINNRSANKMSAKDKWQGKKDEKVRKK